MTSFPEAMGWEFGDFEKQAVGDKMPNWEPAADRGLWALSDPWLSNPAKMRKKYCWVNIAVGPHLQLISHTQPTSTLLRTKCERYIFIKKCVCSFIEVRHYCWLCSAYICIMWLYNKSRSNGNKEILHSWSPELEPWNQMQLSVNPRMSFFFLWWMGSYQTPRDTVRVFKASLTRQTVQWRFSAFCFDQN